MNSQESKILEKILDKDISLGNDSDDNLLEEGIKNDDRNATNTSI